MPSFSFESLLRVWKPTALPPDDLSLFCAVDLSPFKVLPLPNGEAPSRGRAGIIEIASLSLSDYGERPVSGEERDIYENRINQFLDSLAVWLPRLSTDVILKHQADGWKFEVVLSYYLEAGNQMLDVSLSLRPMAEFGRLNMPIEIYSDGFGG